MDGINLNTKAHNLNILLYHQIGESPNLRTNLDCFCKKKEFFQQMEFLANSDYEVISLNKAINLMLYKRIPDKNYIVLTFDDGCERFYDLTFPILEKFNFSSTIYPVTGDLGKYASWGAIKNPDLKILSERMLIELNKLGVEIGSHTVAHLKLTEISLLDATYQIKKSKEMLEQLIGTNICSFAYPHGDFNTKIVQVVRQMGFKCGLTCINNTAEKAKSIFEMPRKYITYFDNLETFKQKLY